MSTVFCNQCFDRASSRSGKRFYCTSCSHVFCSSCLNSCPNFCLICKASCKVLEINKLMPASVKMFFENEEGFQQRIKEAEKVFQFQTSQVSMFVKKNKEYRQQYYRLKKQHHSLVQTEQSLRAAIDKEKAWIEKCKIAYRSNIISPHLFNDTTIDMSIDNTCTSGYGSQASPFFKKTPQKSQVETSTLSDHMSKMNMNRLDERQRSQIPSQSEAQNPYKSSFVETRRNLVDNTLQHMQNISQNKYPTIQRNKM